MRFLIATALEVFICGFFDFKINAKKSDFGFTSSMIGATWLLILSILFLSVLFLAVFNYVDFSGETQDTIRSVGTLYLGYDFTKQGLQLGSRLVLFYLGQRALYALVALSLSWSSFS